MPLHTDYRPVDFAEFIGNERLLQTLVSIFDSDRQDKPHALLFHGPSGTGKTTLARIIAEKLGCPEKLESKESNIDFIEINSSNNRGIDTAREIMKAIHYQPLESKCRVYVLDEVHMTTRDFQNAVLKALEEPPSHTYFILCTTDPQKLIPTIRNRCSKFETRKLDVDEIEQLLRWVLKTENINDFPAAAISRIADIVEGCPREALVALDQVIDLDPANIETSLNEFKTAESQIIDLCRGLLKRERWSAIAKILKNLDEEPEKTRRSVLNYMMAVLLNSKKPDAQAMLVCACFQQTFFYTGKAGLVTACADIYSI